MKVVSTLLFTVLAAVPTASAADAPKSPPEGWKDYTAKGNSFSCWLPTEQVRLKEGFKDKQLEKGQTLRFATVQLEAKDGSTYEAGTVTLMPYTGPITKLKSSTRVDIIRDLFADAGKGKVSDEKEIKQGRVPGKEFVIEARGSASRHRVYAFADRFFVMSVSGTKAQVGGEKRHAVPGLVQDPGQVHGAGRQGQRRGQGVATRPDGGMRCSHR
jgi:hypothetical protein